jgi:tetratricopeptide (TPR) repeat protein
MSLARRKAGMYQQRRRKILRPRLCCVAVGLASMALAAAGPANAQISSFAPSSKTSATVSVRELQIPSEARHEFERGLRRLQKQDPAGSLRHFNAAIQRFPKYFEAYYHLGIAEMKLGKNDEALRSFQAAIDMSEGHYARAQFGYGLALCRRGNAAEAEQIVRYGLETEPNIADGHVVLGVVLLKLNRTDEAEKSARQALLLGGPKSGKGYLVLADVDATRGDYDSQVRDLDSYLKLHPDEPNAPLLHAARSVAKKLAAKIARDVRRAGSIRSANNTP